MSELETGTTIDRYVVQELLGRGGFSTVYRAKHFMIGHSVALKILLPEHTSSPVIRERLFREAKAAASIGNPHIVKVLDCGTSPQGHMFLALEYLEGESLIEVIEREAPLPVERALGISLQILDGLAAAHGSGIIHRDIKPENIYVLEDKEFGGDFIKLLDFGISKVLADNACALTNDGEVLGTPLYMAPEQVSGAANVDHRADLYSVSAVIYHMLAGRLPHIASNLGDLANKLLTVNPATLTSVAPHIPEELSQVVMRGLSRDLETRWLDALSYSKALREFLSDDVTGSELPPDSTDGALVFDPSPVPGSPEASPPLMTPSGQPTTFPNQGWSEQVEQTASADNLLAQSTPSSSGQQVLVQAVPSAEQKIPLWAVVALVAATALVTGGVVLVVTLAVGLILENRPSDDHGPGQVAYASDHTTGSGGPNSLQINQPIMGTLGSGQQVDYPLHIDHRGQRTITLSSSDFDAYLRLLVNGGEMASDDDSGGGLNSRLSLFLEPGDYTLRVGAFENSGGGAFMLTVY